MEDQKAVIVGISGASSSGKTTLARLLRDIFPKTFILHEDDFYRSENELPTRDGLLDWDCAGSLNIPDMTKALSHIRANGTFPPFVDSKEDQNSVGACPVSDAKIAEMKAKVRDWVQPGQSGYEVLGDGKEGSGLRICLLDGFLLYSLEMQSVMDLLDVKMFLLVSRAKATQRREARDGYVTLEGFWKDPEGYVDKIVWPNYADAHAWLFEKGDVEGTLNERVLTERGILAQTGKGLDIDMEITFEWTVETLMKQLEALGKR
ncbi:P-loop containing nucleoside triphosphate hydrolase protein [Pseudomassariella vexata]|uniref:p-loop containing nucleoside triphosphate hydrolase protein n=1 Tax=Pseudomassariella vexata TaxID=1141098 RepID=A0A1Y2DXI1_9PEZI|nr:P-loop containing nucleoside triphosphate hydrolase protein [Pseudomassariella vexata]ORY64008.1 P-loop containing nucleoside triphosphate hydrolase protein [Pseudomassariella vexata]